jgi:hypothetical protein
MTRLARPTQPFSSLISAPIITRATPFPDFSGIWLSVYIDPPTYLQFGTLTIELFHTKWVSNSTSQYLPASRHLQSTDNILTSHGMMVVDKTQQLFSRT